VADRDVGSIIARIRADASQMMATFASAKAQTRGFGNAIGTIGAGFTKAAALTTGFGVAVGGIVKVTGDFQQTMANVGAVTGAVGQDMDELSTIAVEMGKSTIFSASEAGQAMFNLGSAGIKAADDFRNILKPSLDLAAAAQADIGFVTETVIGNIRAFGLETTDAGRVANIFSAANENSALTAERLANALRPVAPLAGSIGVELEDTSAALGVLVNRNFQAEEAGTALRNIFLRLAKPVGDAKVILDEAGFSAERLGELTKDPVELVRQLGEANFTTAEAVTIFGARAVGAFRALEGGVDDMEDLRDAITGTDSASRIATRQLDTFNSQVKLMKSALEALVITIGTRLLPVFRRWVERATEMIGTAIDFVEANGELVKELILGAGKFLVITTAALGFLNVLAKILVVGPKIVAAVKVITLGMPWAALAAAIGFVIVKIIDMRIKVLEAKSAMAGLLATNKKLAENFGKTADALKKVNGDFDKANEIIAERGIKLPFVIQSEEDLARAIKIVEGAQRSRIEADEALTTQEVQSSQERAEAARIEEQEKLNAELERLGLSTEANIEHTQTLTDLDDLRKANAIDAFLGMSDAGTELFSALIKGEQSAEASFNAFIKSIRDTFIRSISAMIAKAVVFFAVIKPLGGLFGLGGLSFRGFMGFSEGGIIPAQGGLIPRGEDTLVAAQAGEAILTRDAVRNLGGPSGIQQINETDGRAGAGGEGGDTFIFDVRSLTGRPTQDDVDFIKEAVQDAKRQSPGGI